MKTRSIFFLALPAALAASSAVWLAPQLAFQAAGFGAAAWAGLVDAPIGARLVALGWNLGGWIGAMAVSSAVNFGIWFVLLTGLFFLIRWIAGRWKFDRFGLVLCSLVAFGVGLLGVWQGFKAWRNDPGDARLYAPVDLIAQAKKNGGRLFVNPSATFDVAVLAPDLLGEASLKARAATMASPVLWRSEDRQQPSSSVLIAGSVSEARPLVEHLLASPDWRLASVDLSGLLFLRGEGAKFSPQAMAEIVAGFEKRDHAYVLARTALNYQEADRKVEARTLMHEAVVLAPEDARVRICAASLAASQGRWERARADAEKALKLNPASRQAKYLLALSLLETRVLQRAHELASELVDSGARDGASLLLHARTSRGANDPISEIASLEKLLALGDASSLAPASVQVYLGQAWAKRGFPDQALKAYQAALDAGLTPGEAGDVREAMKTIRDNRLPVSQ